MYPTQKADLAPTYWEGSCRILKMTWDGTMLPGVVYTEQFPCRSQVPQGMSEQL